MIVSVERHWWDWHAGIKRLSPLTAQSDRYGSRWWQSSGFPHNNPNVFRASVCVRKYGTVVLGCSNIPAVYALLAVACYIYHVGHSGGLAVGWFSEWSPQASGKVRLKADCVWNKCDAKYNFPCVFSSSVYASLVSTSTSVTVDSLIFHNEGGHWQRHVFIVCVWLDDSKFLCQLHFSYMVITFPIKPILWLPGCCLKRQMIFRIHMSYDYKAADAMQLHINAEWIANLWAKNKLLAKLIGSQKKRILSC